MKQVGATNRDQVYPGYVNAQTEDGLVLVTVRGDSPDGARCGDTVSTRMTLEDFALFVARVQHMIGTS